MRADSKPSQMALTAGRGLCCGALLSRFLSLCTVQRCCATPGHTRPSAAANPALPSVITSRGRPIFRATRFSNSPSHAAVRSAPAVPKHSSTFSPPARTPSAPPRGTSRRGLLPWRYAHRPAARWERCAPTLQNLRDEFAHPLPQPLLQTLPPGIPLLLVRARCRATVRHGVSSCGRDLQQRDPGFVFNDFSGAYAFHFSTGIGTEPYSPAHLLGQASRLQRPRAAYLLQLAP